MSCRSRERLPAECARSSSEKWSLALLGTLMRPMKKNELQQHSCCRRGSRFLSRRIKKSSAPAELLATSYLRTEFGSPENFLYRSERFQEIFRSGI
jgi:hypothetical protein